MKVKAVPSSSSQKNLVLVCQQKWWVEWPGQRMEWRSSNGWVQRLVKRKILPQKKTIQKKQSLLGHSFARTKPWLTQCSSCLAPHMILAFSQQHTSIAHHAGPQSGWARPVCLSDSLKHVRWKAPTVCWEQCTPEPQREIAKLNNIVGGRTEVHIFWSQVCSFLRRAVTVVSVWMMRHIRCVSGRYKLEG